MRKKTAFMLCAIIIGICLTSSCSTTSKVSVADGLRMGLLPADAIAEPIESYQLMEGTIPGYGEATLESYLVADQGGLEMYLFAPTGQTIAVVRYDGKKASMDSEFIPYGDIAAAYMVFDVQMCYADCKAITDAGLEIVETQGEARERRILHNGEILYIIRYTESSCMLENVRRAYSYALYTLE